MKKILVVKNITHEGPGLIADVAGQRGAAIDIVDLYRGGILPDIENYSALIILGGPMSANDTTSDIITELAYIQSAVTKRIPVLGICLGLQLIVKALGGVVVKNSVVEAGFDAPDGTSFCVELTEEGAADPLCRGLAKCERVFQLHGETVQFTPSMRLLARGSFCENQIVRAADLAWGIQCHFELTRPMLAEWAALDPALAAIGAQTLLREFDDFEEKYTATGKILVNNFFDAAGI